MTIRRRVIVHGTVQGVGFRYSALAEAQRLAVTGWVRNLEDGTVETEIDGTEAAVEAMLIWLGRGPRWASVTRLEVQEMPLGTTQKSDFEIR